MTDFPPAASRSPVADHLFVFPRLELARPRGLGLLLPQPRRAPRVLYAPHRRLRISAIRRLEHLLATRLVRAGLLDRVLTLTTAAAHRGNWGRARGRETAETDGARGVAGRRRGGVSVARGGTLPAPTRARNELESLSRSGVLGSEQTRLDRRVDNQKMGDPRRSLAFAATDRIYTREIDQH